MKKLFAIIVALALTAALCISSFAGLDSLYINANTLDSTNIAGQAGKAKVNIEKGDKLFILGWMAKQGTTLEKIYWTLDGAEKECSDVYRDRTEIAKNEDFANAGWVADDFVHAGFGKDDGYMEMLGVDALDNGTYAVAIVAKYADDTEADVKSEFTLVVGPEEEEQAQPNDLPKTLVVELIPDANNTVGVDVTENDDGSITAETQDGAGDPFFSIELDEVETKYYTSFTVVYELEGQMHGNNVYLRDTEKNPGYSPTGGTWAPPAMDGKTERTFIISDEFSLLTDTLLTGVRFPGAKPGGKLTIKSITFHNPNGKDGGETPVDPPVEQPAEPVERASASQGGVEGIWLRCDVDGNYPDYGAVFNANKPFTSISSHMFWASNPVAGTGTVNANIIVKLYKFAGTYADSVAGTPVAEATLSGVEGDNQLQKGFSAEGTNATLVPYDGENQGFKFQLKEAAPAGQYVVVVENDAAAGSYIVLPSTKKAEDRNYDKEYIAYYFGGSEANEAWRFLVNFNDGGDFAKLADDTTPETPTETSDMTMVLFIVAAAAIVLVVLKKKAF